MYPDINFTEGEVFSYSHGDSTVTYPNNVSNLTEFLYSLLHETGHAELLHNNFSSDIDLVNIERDAWERSIDIGQKIDVVVDSEHIEKCMDTYRDWLYARSLCPHCHQCGIQSARTTYSCPFCHNSWTVSLSRLCKVSRRGATKK
jgi:hypothetical protein